MSAPITSLSATHIAAAVRYNIRIVLGLRLLRAKTVIAGGSVTSCLTVGATEGFARSTFRLLSPMLHAAQVEHVIAGFA